MIARPTTAIRGKSRELPWNGIHVPTCRRAVSAFGLRAPRCLTLAASHGSAREERGDHDDQQRDHGRRRRTGSCGSCASGPGPGAGCPRGPSRTRSGSDVCQKASEQANEPVMISTLKMFATPIPANDCATGIEDAARSRPSGGRYPARWADCPRRPVLRVAIAQTPLVLASSPYALTSIQQPERVEMPRPMHRDVVAGAIILFGSAASSA